MSTRSAATLGLGLLLAIPAYVAAVALTTVWFERVFLPRIAGED